MAGCGEYLFFRFDWLIWFIVLNATCSNISAISWRPVLVVEKAGVPVKDPGGLTSNSYKPITNTAWVRPRLCKLQKGCIWLTAASDKVYQLLAHGRWFSPGTPASSTTKNWSLWYSWNIAESGVKTPNIKSIILFSCLCI